MAYTPFPNLHITEEQSRKAFEATYGAVPTSKQKKVSEQEDVPQSLPLIHPQASGTIPSPIVPVTEIMMRTPEENIQADINAAHTGNWLQTGYVPTPSVKEEITNTMVNPLTETVAMGLAAEFIGGIWGAGALGTIFTRAGGKALTSPLGKILAPAVEKIGQTPIGKALYSGAPLRIGEKIEIPLRNLVEDITKWSLAGTSVDIGARALKREPINPVNIAGEQFGYNAALFTLVPPGLRGIGFTFSKTGEAVKWGYDKTLKGIIGEYMDVAKDHLASLFKPLSTKAVYSLAENLLKSSTGDRLKAQETIASTFPKVLVDEDFIGLLKSTATKMDNVVGGGQNRYFNRVMKDLIEFEHTGDIKELINKIDTNPQSQVLFEGLLKRRKGFSEDTFNFNGNEIHFTYFETLGEQNAADRLLEKYKPVFDLAESNLREYWEKYLEEYLHITPELPSEFWQEIEKGRDAIALSYIKNEDVKKVLQDAIEDFVKRNPEALEEGYAGARFNPYARHPLAMMLDNVYKALYTKAMLYRGWYITRVGLEHLENISRYPGGATPITYEGVEKMLASFEDPFKNVDLSELKERSYPSLVERVIKHPDTAYKNGWGLQRSYAFSTIDPATIYDLAGWLGHMDKTTKNLMSEALLKGKIRIDNIEKDMFQTIEEVREAHPEWRIPDDAIMYTDPNTQPIVRDGKTYVSKIIEFSRTPEEAINEYLKTGKALNDGVYIISELKKQAAENAGEAVNPKVKRIFLPAAMEKEYFTRHFVPIYVDGVGEKIIGHYKEVNLGGKTYLVHNYYADALSRLIPLTRGETAQLLAPLKGWTKLVALRKGIKLSFSVIHFGALLSAALGIRYGKMATSTLGELLQHTTFSRDAGEFVEKELKDNIGEIADFLNTPGLKLDARYFSLMSVPTERAQLDILKGIARSLNDTSLKRALYNIPGVGNVISTASKGAYALTVGLEDLLWNKFVPLLKSRIMVKMIEEGRAAGLSPQEIYENLTKIQDALGGQAIWHTITPTANSLIRLIGFAPDWYITLTKHVTRMMDGTPEFALFVPRIISTASIIANALSIAFTGEGVIERFAKTHDLRDLGRVPIPVITTSPNGTKEKKIIYIDIFGFQTEGLEFLGILPFVEALTRYATSLPTNPLGGMKAIIQETWDEWGKFIMSKAGIDIQAIKSAGEQSQSNPLQALLANVLSEADPIAISTVSRVAALETDKGFVPDNVKKTELFVLSMLGGRLRTKEKITDQAYKLWVTNTTPEQKRKGIMPPIVRAFIRYAGGSFKQLGYPEKASFESEVIRNMYKKYLKMVYNINVTALSNNKVLARQVGQQAQHDPVLRDLLRHAGAHI